MTEELNCPACGRKIIRPRGSTTTCACGREIVKLTAEELIVAMLTKTNDILGDIENG